MFLPDNGSSQFYFYNIILSKYNYSGNEIISFLDNPSARKTNNISPTKPSPISIKQFRINIKIIHLHFFDANLHI